MVEASTLLRLRANLVSTLDLSYIKIGIEGATELAEALKSNSSLTSLILRCNNIGQKGAIKLAEALKSNSTLTSLSLSNNKIGKEGAIKVFETLKSSSSFTSLDLSCNKIGVKGATQLSEALNSNPFITHLDLYYNAIGDGGTTKLAEALKSNTSLTSLNLSSNNIYAKGATKIAEALTSNSSLTHIELMDNKIGTEGAIKLAEALKSNSSLTSLNLRNTHLGSTEVIKLSEALKSNSTLTSLDLSNNNITTPGAMELFEALQSNSSLTQVNLWENIHLPDIFEQLSAPIHRNLVLWRNIHECIRTNDLEQLKTLLSKHTINLNSFNLYIGDTILHSAAKSNSVKMIEFILQRISPSTKQLMMKMKNNQKQLPSDVLTIWTPSIHSLFPLKFRRVVKAVLMLGAKRQDGAPYYPQTHFYKLPKDVLFLILHYAALPTETEEETLASKSAEQHESNKNESVKRLEKEINCPGH